MIFMIHRGISMERVKTYCENVSEAPEWFDFQLCEPCTCGREGQAKVQGLQHKT